MLKLEWTGPANGLDGQIQAFELCLVTMDLIDPIGTGERGSKIQPISRWPKQPVAEVLCHEPCAVSSALQAAR